MAELADAHGSGPCESNFMGVQVPLPAEGISRDRNPFCFIGNCFAIPIKQKSPPGDAHSRVRKLLLSQPRSARAFCEQNAFLFYVRIVIRSLLQPAFRKPGSGDMKNGDLLLRHRLDTRKKVPIH